VDDDAYNLVMLFARLSFGFMFIYHGRGKLKSGIEGTASWFESMGMKPGMLNARAAIATEIGAGVLMVLGLLTSLAATAMVAVMLVAAITTHVKHGFSIMAEGWEYVYIISVGAIMIATFGPGEWSVDNQLDIITDLNGWTGLLLASVGGVAGGAAQLAAFYRPPAAE
jgi:putative oxidoreductase